MPDEILIPDYTDKKTQRDIRHIISGMGLCGCGTVDKYAIVYQLLLRAEADGSFYQALVCEKVAASTDGRVECKGEIEMWLNARAVEFIADVMSTPAWDLLEHGSGIGASWLTKNGKMLLAFFREHGTDAHTWPF